MATGLIESCTQHEGRLLYFKTHYGWGWGRMESDPAPEVDEDRTVPPPFHVRVHYFYRHGGLLRGAVGVIEEPGHKYDGRWAVFYTRGGMNGMSDLTENLDLCDILIGPDEPFLCEWKNARMTKMWPCWRYTQSPQIVGYGMIAASEQDIQNFECKCNCEPPC